MQLITALWLTANYKRANTFLHINRRFVLGISRYKFAATTPAVKLDAFTASLLGTLEESVTLW